MKITIITGEKGSGKSTYLKSILNSHDGIVTVCDNRERKIYSFLLIKLHKNLSCCYYDKKMIFNDKNFKVANEYLKNIKSKKVIIDEIGWLELEGRGFSNSLNHLLKSNIDNLVLTMRFDSYKKLIKKYKINNYVLIIL